MTQVSSHSLTNFISWGWLDLSGQRDCRPEPPNSQLLLTLSNCSAVITRGTVECWVISGVGVREEKDSFLNFFICLWEIKKIDYFNFLHFLRLIVYIYI